MTQNKNEWINKKTLIKILSLLIAFVCWVFVASTGMTSRNVLIKDVPVNISLQEEILSEIGLNIIEMSNTEVTAEVRGERVSVGQISPDEITATIQLPNNFDDGENVFNLKLVPLNSLDVKNKNYEVVSYDPPYITVKLDEIQTKTLPVTVVNQSDIRIAEGYVQEKATVVSPSEIVISGPNKELQKVSKIVAEINVEDELNKSYIAEQRIKIIDEQGNEIDAAKNHLKTNYTEVKVVIPLLKEKKLPLTVEFINVPRNFPIEHLSYKLSDKEVLVAGPVETLDKYNEILLGYIDIQQISKNKNEFAFDVDLPDKFTNMDKLETVTVTFDSSQWAETVLDINDVRISNMPDGYEIELITDKINDVKMVGEAGIINKLTSEDLVAEINMAERSDISTGQYQYPVKISAPTKQGLVWANGEYSIVIKATKLEQD